MKNDKRSGVFIGFAAAPLRCAVLLCFVAGNTIVPLTAFADVGLPPPAQHQSSGFPSEKALEQKGYNPKTGVWRVQSQNNGRPTVTKDGGTIKGTQAKTVTVTGKYGEKGVMHTTQTQSVSSSKLATVANGAIAANFVGRGMKYSAPYIENATRGLKNGNYGTAAHNAAMAAGAFLDGILDGGLGEVSRAVGRGLGTLPSDPSSGQLTQAAQKAATAQAQAEQGGNLGGAIAAAAAKKAAEGAAKAAEGDKAYKEAKKKQSEGKEVYQVVMSYTDYGITPVKSQIVRMGAYTDKSSNKYGTSYATYDNKGGRTIVRSSVFDSYLPKSLSGGGAAGVGTELVLKETPPPETVKPEDMTLSQQDIKEILARMLNNQQTNHEELMNQLSRIGDAVEKSTESNQFKPVTADSAPYTPEGSNTPQQTRFTLNADGSVSTSIVPRPDLKPNSTLAPTRSEIVPNPNKGQDNPTIPTKPNNPDSPNTPTTPSEQNSPNAQQNQGQNQANRQNENQQGLLCQVFPNIAACADLGESDYEDVQIPENPIDLGSLKPIDYFSTNGQCPAPASFQLGALGSFDFDYSYVCRVAETVRPIVILGTIIICSWMAYSAIKEL
jgi:putative integumentary mucin A.1